MSKVPQALKILVQARDNYVERISAWVIENEDELLRQSEGTGYAETEDLFRAGEELRSISVILGHMPQPQQAQQTLHVQAFEPISFGMWADQIRGGDLNGATMSLSYLFQIDRDLAAHCVNHFVVTLREDPALFQKFNLLRQALEGHSLSSAIQLLAYCFGLNANNAVAIATYLQTTF